MVAASPRRISRPAAVGVLDGLLDGHVCGWAAPLAAGKPRAVTLHLDGEAWVTVPADHHRPDLPQYDGGACGFFAEVPMALRDGRCHDVAAFCDGVPLVNSPLSARIPVIEAVHGAVGAHRHQTFENRLTLVAICRDEGPYVDEWVAYHRALGVDRILIYDNDSRDGTSERLERLAAQGLVETVPWPTDPGWRIGPQIPAYEDAARRVGTHSEWLLPLDLDEFLVVKCDGGLPGLLDRFPDVAALAIYWRVFGSGGATTTDPGLVIERFTHCAPSAHPINNVVKTAVRTSYLSRVGVHVPFVSAGPIVDEAGRVIDPLRGGVGIEPSHALCQVNHYFTKSRLEWETKKQRGRADLHGSSPQKYRTDDDFAAHNRNEDTCRVAADHAATVRTLMTAWTTHPRVFRDHPGPTRGPT